MYCLNGNERHFLRASDDGDMEAVWCVPPRCVGLACTFSPSLIAKCSVFSPPVAGTEDHNEHGVYPAVDDDGVKHYSYGADKVSKLFSVPEALRSGSEPSSPAERAPKKEPTASEDGVAMRTPTQADAKEMYRIVKSTTLDDNSAYAYLLACSDFANSSIGERAPA